MQRLSLPVQRNWHRCRGRYSDFYNKICSI
jgi:hypothetical protein